jgi:hypothetical protein
MKGVSAALLLAALLSMAGGRPALAADTTPKQPQVHRPAIRAKPVAPSLHRRPGRETGVRREEGQAHFGSPNPGIPTLPGVPAPVQNIIGGILGGIVRPPQPATPAGYWYWCDASGQYYPNVATCASGWRPVNPR